MPSKQPPALQSIDPTALANVSGGAARAGRSTDAGSTGGADASVVTALTSILDSIQDLARSRNSGGFSTQDLALLMMVMQQRNQPVVVQAQPRATTWPFPPGIY